MSSFSSENYYDVLKVSNTVSFEDIRTAYKKMAKERHPDKAAQNHLTDQQATVAFQLLNEAYGILSNPEKRKLYDRRAGLTPVNQSTASHTSFSSPFSASMYTEGYKSEPERKEEQEEFFCPKQVDEKIILIIDSDEAKEFDAVSKEFDKPLLQSILYHACKMGKFNIVKFRFEWNTQISY